MIVTPYTRAAPGYALAGWSPVPMTGATKETPKGTPYPGTTGREGMGMTPRRVELFCSSDQVERYPNISLRMVGTVGLDIDAYDGRPGAATLADLETKLGPLPPTWLSSAREMPSGIRIFRLPEGVELGKDAEAMVRTIGEALDVIRFDHRYVKCWPTPHPGGTLYRWFRTPFTAPCPDTMIPLVSELPELPASWVEFLTSTPPAKISKGRAKLPRNSDGERVFTPEEAQAFVAPFLTAVRNTPWGVGAGFNAALNDAAYTLRGFLGFWSEEEILDMLAEAVETGHGTGLDSADLATIRSGLGSPTDWSARRPDARDFASPFSRYYTGPVALAPEVPPSNPGDAVAAPGAPGPDVFLPEEFWAARPLFGVLRQAAWAQLESPEGVLFAALELIVARVMPNVVLFACVGAEASLNGMLILAGDPGDGKSVCRKIASDTLRFEGCEPLHRFSPSSGQGVSGQYQYLKKEKGQPAHMEPSRYTAMAMVEESETVAALSANPTSTLASELRKAAMGEDLGFANIGDTQTSLPEGTYRFVLIMCLQPELGAWVMSEAAGGLPQRFLWACVRDDREVRDLPHPGQVLVRLPFEATPADAVTGQPRERYVMGRPDSVCEDVRAARRARRKLGRKAGAENDGHRMLLRLKVAARLALADGRIDLSTEDWELAGMVMLTSDATRAWVNEILADAATRANAARATARGAARVIENRAASVEISRDVLSIAGRLLAIVASAGPAGMTSGQLNRRMHRDDKELIRRAVAELEVEEKIRVEETTVRGKTVSTIYLAGTGT